jgi:hypothetical protein
MKHEQWLLCYVHNTVPTLPCLIGGGNRPWSIKEFSKMTSKKFLQLFHELRYTGHIVVDGEKKSASPERVVPLLLAMLLSANFHATD